MEYLNELFKGVVIGVANILPGISGGMLAITMGVYDKIIHAVNRLFKEPVKSIRVLFPYGIGAMVGIVFLSLAFEYLFHTYPLQTKMAFLGLIAGGLPSLFSRAGGRDEADRNKGFLISALTAAFVICFTVFGTMSLASGRAGGEMVLGSGRFWILTMILIGLLAAGTMVVPGVSGSMIMMMLGVYEPLLRLNNSCIRAVFSLDLPSLLSGGLVLAPYFIGLAGGIFVFARIIEHLLSSHEKRMYQIIIGLVFSSPVVVLWNTPWKEIKAYEILFGLALGLLGFVLADWLGGEG